MFQYTITLNTGRHRSNYCSDGKKSRMQGKWQVFLEDMRFISGGHISFYMCFNRTMA